MENIVITIFKITIFGELENINLTEENSDQYSWSAILQYFADSYLINVNQLVIELSCRQGNRYQEWERDSRNSYDSSRIFSKNGSWTAATVSIEFLPLWKNVLRK